MSGGFFRGTNLDQDLRFGDGSKRLIKDTTFSSLLKCKVDMAKVNMEVIKPWIATTVNELLGVEDEVLLDYIVNLLSESNTPDPKSIQVNLTGFLESKTQGFMQDLWTLLLEAQDCQGGIPESLVKKKMDQMQKKREMEAKIREQIRISNERSHGPSGSRDSYRRRTDRRSRWNGAGRNRDDSRERRRRSRSRSLSQDSRRERRKTCSRSRSNSGTRYRSGSRSRDRTRSRSRSRTPDDYQYHHRRNYRRYSRSRSTEDRHRRRNYHQSRSRSP